MRVLIVIPVYNEEKIIKDNLKKLNLYLKDKDFGCQILVADNCSTDKTSQIVKELARQIDVLNYLYLDKKGKGRAVLTAWQKYQDNFDVFIFMDADLATDLEALPKLIKGIAEGHDIVVGSRYLKDSQVKRSFFRKVFSFGYRLFLRLILGTQIKDMPCGFKAVNQKAVKKIVPQIKNKTWFFDTEMIYLAEKNNFKIKEIPIRWQEPRAKNESKVGLLKVSFLYFKEVLRLKFRKQK